MDRRRFLKYAGATAAVVGVSVLGLNYFANVPIPKTTNSTMTTASSQMTQSSSTSPNIPLAVKDLNDRVAPFFKDLNDLASGMIVPYSLENGADVYRTLKSHAENLREALRNYKSENAETEGQVRRLDQTALGALCVYSWTSRMVEDDLNVAHDVGGYKGNDETSSIGTNLSVVKHPAGELAWQLHEERYGNADLNSTVPDQYYLEEVGKKLTDVKNENLIAPRHRFWLKHLLESLDAGSGAVLKQSIESYDSETDPIGDYTSTTEEQLALLGLNRLLDKTDESNNDLVTTSVENSIKRNSSLGAITKRGMALIVETTIAMQNGYSQQINSAYKDLPANHTELGDYDFALTLMKTHTFLSERKVGYPTHAWDTEFRLERIFYGAASLAGRDVYTVSVHPWGTDENFVDHMASIKQDGKYYVTAVDGGKLAYTADQLGPPLLYDMSDPNWGYTGYRKYVFIIVAKHLFGTSNVIPVFAYNPEKGVVNLGS